MDAANENGLIPIGSGTGGFNTFLALKSLTMTDAENATILEANPDSFSWITSLAPLFPVFFSSSSPTNLTAGITTKIIALGIGGATTVNLPDCINGDSRTSFNPNAGNNGSILIFVNAFGGAHVINFTGTNKLNGSKVSATFTENVGECIILVAINGTWITLIVSAGIALA